MSPELRSKGAAPAVGLVGLRRSEMENPALWSARWARNSVRIPSSHRKKHERSPRGSGPGGREGPPSTATKGAEERSCLTGPDVSTLSELMILTGQEPLEAGHHETRRSPLSPKRSRSRTGKSVKGERGVAQEGSGKEGKTQTPRLCLFPVQDDSLEGHGSYPRG
jgi:hypothetical protein